ncbi:MAG TPA: hypothetical protein P5159_15525 [Phycisphaerae bacterium]|nr:hypothetical protein [Phycisphaerae bacterium]
MRNGILRIKHRQPPRRGHHKILEAGIDQICCRRRKREGRRKRRLADEVNAALTDNRKITLVTSLNDEDQALFIEQALEEHPDIVNRRVPGEYRF